MKSCTVPRKRRARRRPTASRRPPRSTARAPGIAPPLEVVLFRVGGPRNDDQGPGDALALAKWATAGPRDRVDPGGREKRDWGTPSSPMRRACFERHRRSRAVDPWACRGWARRLRDRTNATSLGPPARKLELIDLIAAALGLSAKIHFARPGIAPAPTIPRARRPIRSASTRTARTSSRFHRCPALAAGAGPTKPTGPGPRRAPG